MKFLNDINTAADPLTVAQSNFETIERRSFYLEPTNVKGVATAIVGPPDATTGAHDLDELWVDANRTIYRCTVAATPGTWVKVHSYWLTGSASLNFPSIAAQATSDLTIAVTGAAVGDPVLLALPAAPDAGIVFNAWVSAADVVTIRASNISAAAIDPAAATFKVAVMKN